LQNQLQQAAANTSSTSFAAAAAFFHEMEYEATNLQRQRGIIIWEHHTQHRHSPRVTICVQLSFLKRN
jgi:hypothetical protein